MRVGTFPAARRHTLYFLEDARSIASVYLDISIHMDRALELIDSMRSDRRKIGVNSVLIWAISRAMVAIPEVNIGVAGRIRARQFLRKSVTAKFTLDKEIAGQRIVCSASIQGAERMSLHEIQSHIDFYKSASADEAACFSSLRMLHKLPPTLGYWLYKRIVGRLDKRAAIHGSFALTSLARSSVSGFYPLSGGTLTFGVGRISETPTVENGCVIVRKTLRLCLAFDHRAIDGAVASEFLDRIKLELESIKI